MEERDIIQLEKCCCCSWVSSFHVTLDQIFSMHNTVQVRMTKIFSLSKSAENFCVACEPWRGTCARLAASGRVELAAVPPPGWVPTPHLRHQTRPVREHGLGTTRQASFRRTRPILTRPYGVSMDYILPCIVGSWLNLHPSKIKNSALYAQYSSKDRPPIYHITFTSPTDGHHLDQVTMNKP